MITKTAVTYEDLLTGLELLKELKSESNTDLADTAQLLIDSLKKTTFDDDFAVPEARIKIQYLTDSLGCNRSTKAMLHAENVEILDQEAREELGFSIFPITRSVKADLLQTLRLNMLKKIRENLEKGVNFDSPSTITIIVDEVRKDDRLNTLEINEDVIVEILMNLLFKNNIIGR